jgi:uncharacterized protein YvpB
MINVGTRTACKSKNKIDILPNGEFRLHHMTICIAMILDHFFLTSQKVILMSDRLESLNNPFFTYEGNPKTDLLHVNAYVLSSGDAVESDQIILKTQNKYRTVPLENKKCTIEELADTLSKECKLKFESELEEIRKQIFSRYKLTAKQLVNNSKKISERLIEIVNGNIQSAEKEFKNNYSKFEFLVVGMDTKPHIFLVDQFGKKQCLDKDGFAVIGSGSLLALEEIKRLGYANMMSEAQAVITIYNAKKRAEWAIGVGEQTDLIVISRDDADTFIHEIGKDFLKNTLDKNIEKTKEKERNSNYNFMKKIENMPREKIFSSHYVSLVEG